MKTAVKAIKFFERFADEGLRGKVTKKFFSGLLKIINPRAKLIDKNLKMIFPDSSEKWRKETRSKIYENLAWTLTETLVLQHDNSKAREWLKNVKGVEIVNDLMAKKQGALIITGHFGNWELAGNWVAQNAISHGHELNVLYQEMHDKDISDYVREMREHGGMRMIDKNISVMKISHMLKDGAHVALLNDVSGNREMTVPFLGHDATNMPGPAIMAILSGVPVVPFCSYRISPFNHEAEFFPPLKLPEKNEIPNKEERIKVILSEMNKALGNFILKRPEQWFWLHNRWK